MKHIILIISVCLGLSSITRQEEDNASTYRLYENYFISNKKCFFTVDEDIGVASRNGHGTGSENILLKPIIEALKDEFVPSESMLNEYCGTDKSSNIAITINEENFITDAHSLTEEGGIYDLELIKFFLTWTPSDKWVDWYYRKDTYYLTIRANK